MTPAYLTADPLAARLAGLDDDAIYDLCERAAIMEFDGGMDRAAAEAEATGGV